MPKSMIYMILSCARKVESVTPDICPLFRRPPTNLSLTYPLSQDTLGSAAAAAAASAAAASSFSRQELLIGSFRSVPLWRWKPIRRHLVQAPRAAILHNHHFPKEN
jgi:hypothetical protein